MDEKKFIEMAVDIKWIKDAIEKHLALHAKLFFTGLGITGTLIIALILLITSG